MKTEGYYYDRTNSKGKAIFRRDTNESLDDVKEYLDSEHIEYEVKPVANMVWVYRDKKYGYYYTTGRWAPFVRGAYPKKHYRSNGIKDFIVRFTKETV